MAKEGRRVNISIAEQSGLSEEGARQMLCELEILTEIKILKDKAVVEFFGDKPVTKREIYVHPETHNPDQPYMFRYSVEDNSKNNGMGVTTMARGEYNSDTIRKMKGRVDGISGF